MEICHIIQDVTLSRVTLSKIHSTKSVQYASDAELQRFLDEVIEGGPEFIRVRSSEQKVKLNMAFSGDYY